MHITRVSPVTNTSNTMEVDCTQEEYDEFARGTFIQHAMPKATPEQREFVLSGLLPQEWNSLYPPDEDEEMDKYMDDIDKYLGRNGDNGVSGFDDPNSAQY